MSRHPRLQHPDSAGLNREQLQQHLCMLATQVYLIDNNVIEHIPMPKGGAYNPLELDDWLKKKLHV